MTKEAPFSPKVLIVGGGLAGICLGILLKRNNVNVLVVERSKTALATFKGEYLQPSTVNFLTNHGMGEIFANTNAGIIRELHFRDLKTVNSQYKVESDLLIRYPEGEVARSLPYVKLQNELRKLAHEELGDDFLEGATVMPMDLNSNGSIKSSELSKPKLEIKYEGKSFKVNPDWVIGCDGKGSQVRKWINGTGKKVSKTVTIGSAAEYIVGCEINCNASIPNRYEVIRTPGDGTFSFFGLGNEKQRLYWNTDKANEGGKLWKESIRKSLENLGHISHIDHENVGNPMGAEANSAWFGPSYKGRYILVGDATSTTTPFGGQGMNVVVKHVEYLSTLLSGSDKRIISGLDNYQSMVFKHYTQLSLLNFCLYHLFFNRSSLSRPVTAHALNRWEQKPYLKERVARLFGGLDQDIPKPHEIYELWGGIPAMRPAPLYANIKAAFTR